MLFVLIFVQKNIIYLVKKFGLFFNVICFLSLVLINVALDYDISIYRNQMGAP